MRPENFFPKTPRSNEFWMNEILGKKNVCQKKFPSKKIQAVKDLLPNKCMAPKIEGPKNILCSYQFGVPKFEG